MPNPNAPQGATGVINVDGSITVDFNSVSGAQSYVIHYGGANQTDPHDSTMMGYSETNSWTLATADVPELKAGDTISLYVQSYQDKGVGADEVEKARYLHDGEFTGSAWSAEIKLTK